jgi:peptidoglycan/LPS O-acetylase OafA/YrhL
MFGSLTAMRGVAALLVAFFHLRWGIMGIPVFEAYVFSFRCFQKSYVWVDFFFILSGFVLAYRYGNICRELTASVYGRFVWQRLVRIWPLQVVTVGAAVGYLGWKYGVGYFARGSIIVNLLLVHGWGRYFPPLNFPSWSLSCEWGAYLLLPLYLFAIRPIRRGLILHVLLVTVLLAGLWWYWSRFGHGSLDGLREVGGLPRCLFEVAIGVSLLRLNEALRQWQSTRSARLCDALAALVFAATFITLTYTASDFYFVPLAASMILSLSLAKGPFSTALECRPMIFLGEVSFSIYMWHAFVLWACEEIPLRLKANWGFGGGTLLLLGELLALIGLATLSFALIERFTSRKLRDVWWRYHPARDLGFNREKYARGHAGNDRHERSAP